MRPSHKGTKVIFVTHDIKQAKRIADDILFIHRGQVVAHKPALDFFLDPGSDEAQAYLDGRVRTIVIKWWQVRCMTCPVCKKTPIYSLQNFSQTVWPLHR